MSTDNPQGRQQDQELTEIDREIDRAEQENERDAPTMSPAAQVLPSDPPYNQDDQEGSSPS